MESNQVHFIADTVSCDSQQIIHTVKTRFTGETLRDLGDADLRNRIHDDVALFHLIPPTNLHMGARPDANAASDSPLPYSIPQVFAENHMEHHPRPCE
jgi:hypothetical protein